MQLSPHFTLEEMTASENAARLGIDNYPTAIAYENLKMLAVAAEQIRDLLGYPMHVNSAYRSQRLNSLTPGSSKTSAHMDGLAMDFTCAGFGTPLEICRTLQASKLPFDQVIHEFNSWCHFAIAHRGLIGRRDVLTIDRNGTRKGLENI